MGHQIIRQPGLKRRYAIFSSGSDRWIARDLDWGEVIEFYAERAAERAREDTDRILRQIDEDPRQAYYQFAMTFEEANAMSAEHGGEDLSGKLKT